MCVWDVNLDAVDVISNKQAAATICCVKHIISFTSYNRSYVCVHEHARIYVPWIERMDECVSVAHLEPCRNACGPYVQYVYLAPTMYLCQLAHGQPIDRK